MSRTIDPSAVEQLLRDLPRREREALYRFYAMGQTNEQICSEMKLSEAELTQIKTRMRARVRQVREQAI